MFAGFRAEQALVAVCARPCLLIDRPEVFRRMCRMNSCRPAKNMPQGYLDGEIARALEVKAAEYRELSTESPVAD